MREKQTEHNEKPKRMMEETKELRKKKLYILISPSKKRRIAYTPIQ